MKLKIFGVLLLNLFLNFHLHGQVAAYDFYVTVNSNLYLPINTPAKGLYPVIGYDGDNDPKILIGGLALGVTAFSEVVNKLHLKGQVNLSKHTYWDEPITIRDERNVPVGEFITSSSDYSLDLNFLAHYLLDKKISVGTGIGSKILLASVSRLPNVYGTAKPIDRSITLNHYYKRIMPVWPVEIILRLETLLFSLRYEHGLLNRLRKDLAEFRNDRFGLLIFELGVSLN